MAHVRVEESFDTEAVLQLLDPTIARWFRSRFASMTDPQRSAIPLIHEGRHVLVSSPTGTGKTITAFLAIINELFLLQQREQLRDQIYAVYISPLKALANDINKNLNEPLQQIAALASQAGEEVPTLRVAVRSGDTTNAERQKMAKTPPHILITTPESLSLMLSTPKFKENFTTVRWVIVDEIHEVSSSKRGVFLSLALERLQAQVPQPLVRIGLSATQAPIEEIATFLGGLHDGLPRPVHIVEVDPRKSLDVAIVTPVEDLTALPYEVVGWKLHETVRDLINSHTTTLVFTNTRSGTEGLVHRLTEDGVTGLAAHHGSLSREHRLDVEGKLRQGELQAVASSTSLELGIDIGSIDLVIQLGSPKSIAKGLQRIGRAGHSVGQVAKGRVVVSEIEDLLESAVLVRCAHQGIIDRVRIPHDSLDVLSQALVGMALERTWGLEEAYQTIRRSACYATLDRARFDRVIAYLAGTAPGLQGAFSRLWVDTEQGVFGAKRGSRMIYYLNLGTIPEEASYRVLGPSGPIGKLSEKFVERLGRGDTFILGGRTYEFEKTQGMKVYVKAAPGKRPTLPSWSGEMLPRSYDLSIAVARFRGELAARLRGTERAGATRARADAITAQVDRVVDELQREYHVDAAGARSLVSHLREQMSVFPQVPSDQTLLVEGYLDSQGAPAVICHWSFGRRVNEALARALARALGQQLGGLVGVSVTDDTFMLTLPRRIDLQSVATLLAPEELEPTLRASLLQTELFKQRFRHCAQRSFLVLRNYRGGEISLGRQLRHTQRLIDSITDETFPVVEETFNELLHDAMDVDGATEVLRSLRRGALQVVVREYDQTPTPFSHQVILVGAADLIDMDDRSALLRELHQQVLKRLMVEVPSLDLDPAAVEAYFAAKRPVLRDVPSLVALLRLVGPLPLLGDDAVQTAEELHLPIELLRPLVSQGLSSGALGTIRWRGLRCVPADELPIHRALYGEEVERTPAVEQLLSSLPTLRPMSRGPKGLDRLEKALLVTRTSYDADECSTWREVTERPAEKERAVRERIISHLRGHGPASTDLLSQRIGVASSLVSAVLPQVPDLFTGAVTEAMPQHMLVPDKLRLAGGRDRPLVEQEQLRAFLLRHYFHSCADIDAYFDTFLEASLSLDIFNHVAHFDMERWWQLREQEAVMEGRLMRGNVVYMRASDVPMAQGLQPPQALTSREAAVLEQLRVQPGANLVEIVRSLPGYDREAVKEAVDGLDRKLRVYRPFSERREWATRNRYAPLPEVAPSEQAVEGLLLRLVRAHGASSKALLRTVSGLPQETVRLGLQVLLQRGEITEVAVVEGGTTHEHYVASSRAQELFSTTAADQPDKGRLRVLSLYDPYSMRLWHEVIKRFGEGWIFPAIYEGELVGMVELWSMSGCVEVRQLRVDEALLPQMLTELQRLMGYYAASGTDLLRLRAINDVPALDLSEGVREHLRVAGFRRIADFYVAGPLDERRFPAALLRGMVLARQGVHPQHHFRNTLEAVRALGGLHSDIEVSLRVRAHQPLVRFKEMLHQGMAIPEVLTYATEEDLQLFRRAKGRALDPEMAHLLQLLENHGAMTRKELRARANLDDRTFGETLKRLFCALYLVRDLRNRYISLAAGSGGLRGGEGMAPGGAPSVAEHEMARATVLRRIVERFGVVSAEGLATYTKHEYKMQEIRTLLHRWEQEGWLVKGYLMEGSDTLYWALAAELDSLERYGGSGEVVLPNTDPVVQLWGEEIRARFQLGSAYLVLKDGELVAAIKAHRKGGQLNYGEVVGDERGLETLKAFGRRWGLKTSPKEEETADADEEDWELMLWYERLSAGSR